MFLNRGKNGFNWYKMVVSQDAGGNETKAYINFSFKKGQEPMPNELTEYGSYQGDLIFRDSTGREWEIYPIAKEYNGVKYVEFKLMNPSNEYKDPEPTYRPVTNSTWEIKRDDVPTDLATDDDLDFM